MSTLKGFTTKNNVLQQLKAAGIGVTVSFVGNSELQVTQNPFEGMEVRNGENGIQKITIST